MKGSDYKICRNADLEELEKEVKGLVESGYTPLGGIVYDGRVFGQPVSYQITERENARQRLARACALPPLSEEFAAQAQAYANGDEKIRARIIARINGDEPTAR